MRCRHIVYASTVASVAASATANAAGFALKEQSATGLGSAFAGQAAGTGDISTMFFNPATLTLSSGNQASASLTAIAPQVQLRDTAASTITGSPIAGGNGGSDVADDVLLPAVYGLWDLDRAFDTGYKLRLGLGLNVPFGLETDYNAGWIGRYHALHSKLVTVNINPVIAFEPIPGLSLGAGLQVQYADATLTNAVDFGTIGDLSGIPFAVPATQDGRARISGKDWSYSFTLGAMAEPWEGTRVGLGYRSKVKHTLRGRASFRLDDAGVGAALSSATGAFRNTDAAADLTTPESVNIGVYQALGERWALSGEAQWTRWSQFKDLTVTFANPAQPTSFTEHNWDDSWFFAIGLTYMPTDAWTLRAGYAYDQSPVPNSTRTPRIPDGDRHWLAIGATYQPAPNLLLSAGYTHIFVRDESIDLSADGTGETFRGNLSADIESAIDMVAVQVEWRF